MPKMFKRDFELMADMTPGILTTRDLQTKCQHCNMRKHNRKLYLRIHGLELPMYFCDDCLDRLKMEIAAQ